MAGRSARELAADGTPRSPRSPWRRHHWHDPGLARLAAAAESLAAVMAAPRPSRPVRRESLRAEARRRGVTVSRVRVDRARAEGISPRVALGHAPPGEPGLRQLRAERAWGASFYIRSAEGGAAIYSADMPFSDAQKAGRYMQLSERLAKGRLGPEEFRRKVLRMGEIDGRRPLSDPVLVLGIVAEERLRRRTGEPEVRFDSGRKAVQRARSLILARRARQARTGKP